MTVKFAKLALACIIFFGLIWALVVVLKRLFA
jgi:hypothetical protein